MSKKAVRMWAIIRRVQYAVAFFTFWLSIGMVVYFVNFYQSPDCFDLVENGNERGVDCGGDCVRICADDVLAPRLVWAKSFVITKGQYNTVAYVENPNQTSATPQLKYTFQLLNKGTVITERSGVTILPPNSVYPIFEGRIYVDPEQEITETRVVLEPSDIWLPASLNRAQFRSLDIELKNADVRPRLNVKLENTDISVAENVEVVATIFNEAGEPVTSSQTFIERIAGQSAEDIVFTWPNTIAKTVKSCIIPTDVAITVDLSGSMNNDSDNPPQPITDALASAGQFAGRLKAEDQSALITFASRAVVTRQLGKNHQQTKQDILSQTINPVEETGYTNTAEALKQAKQELNSERHNQDARRVVVLLTDGLPTAPGDEDVLSLAQSTATELKEDNIEIYAIGLGLGVNLSFIESIASGKEQAYLAPTASDLNRIYGEITSSLCESGPTKIDVIAKTTTNFAPLR
jgi:Mg-chelatase subunit ChlD